MRLVPKQLLRAGMTGQAPYYGGRMTPAQAYAASHPSWTPPGPAAAAPQPSIGRAPLPSGQDSLSALQHLLDSGVLTQTEYDDLRSRLAQ
jgi:hypothetical protein